MRAQPSSPALSWRLLPWQHLASTLVPAAVLLGALALPEAGTERDEPPRTDAAEVFASFADQDVPEGPLVVIGGQGLHVVWAEPGVSGAELHARSAFVPCSVADCPDSRAWDLDAMRGVLRALKAQHPSHDTLTLAPAEDVPFRAVTDAVAAARFDEATPLFPYAVISRRP